KGTRYTSEEIALQLDEKRQDIKTKVEKYTNTPINDLTAEDEEKLFKGEITFEDISEKYNLPLDVMKEDEYLTPKEDITPIVDSQAIDKVIGDSVSKMYALKAKYVSKLGELERNVVEEYSKLPKEKQNKNSKKDIISKNINYVANLEQKCDKEVEELLKNLEKKLKELNGDKEIIKTLKEAYYNEKELKKSYYLSLYYN
ncbi:MAG: hypothetical protein PHT02_14615, partial [Tissierellia bacterium]|nr:hypothetical protein [Tissierellia bacterium]